MAALLIASFSCVADGAFTFRHHAVHFEGVVVGISGGSAAVSLPDERRQWQVQRVCGTEFRGRRRQLGMTRGGLFILLLIPMAGFLSHDVTMTSQA